MSSRTPAAGRGSQPSLFDVPVVTEEIGRPAPQPPVPVSPAPPDRDELARRFAADPRNNVVLEASAGTGKTSVLVARYLNLLRAGVEPANILAITFTRKAAAEMRERIVSELRDAASRSASDKARWNDLRDRLGEISIGTIDAFCLSLLREFPLEADVDPGFDMADETEVPRLIEESLDQSLRIFTRLARSEPDVALVLAQLGLSRTREGLASLLDRRLVAWAAIERFLVKAPADLTSGTVCRQALTALDDALRSAPVGLQQLLDDGPVHHPRYRLLVAELRRLGIGEGAGGSSRVPAAARTDSEIRGVIDRVAAHFLTNEGTPRLSGAIHPYKAEHYPSVDASKRHRTAVAQLGPDVERIVAAFARDLNAIMVRGIRRMFAIALSQYRRALDDRSVLDFSDVLQRALDLLRQMDEFAQSRYRLESRYHHVLVDEFQDTSRAQWELVSLLVQSWGEGLGLPTHPSVFIVGDRKQSIYRFRDAEVAVLQEAGRYIETLRPLGSPRRSIARSFRAVPELLAFVNDAFAAMSQPEQRAGEFTYGESDRFPIDPPRDAFQGPVLGIAVADETVACASIVAAEIARILREDTVRDRKTGVRRQAAPGDIGILFRSRASHREFEHELEQLGIPTYVYKGLGFFDADETKDVVALIRYLARPVSDLRAAAFLRSRFIRLSDPGLAALAPRLAAALIGDELPDALNLLGDEDRRVMLHARAHVHRWLQRVDRVAPADLLEEILRESAYAYELRGARRIQAWENLKKIRAMVRRVQNRGYATLPRIAEHIDALTAGDESNAVIEALDAVNLMTVHASKGLEFPIVFVVNMAKGASGPAKPIRVITSGDDDPSVSVGPFVSDVDEADREREKHETRRLLYVAFTRARDRLYLSSSLKGGAFVAGRGSLGEVLPDATKQLFARAAVAGPDAASVQWTGASGRVFDFKVCRDQTAESLPAAGPDARVTTDLLAPAATAEHSLSMSVSEWLETFPAETRGGTVGSGDVAVGRLVHRLLQFDDRVCSSADVGATARALLETGEIGTLDDPEAVVNAAVAAWRTLRARPEVQALSSQGRHHVEVPFSFREPGSNTLLRGIIDWMVEREDGGVTVVEFKTGAPRLSHERQLGLYVRAAERLFPGARIDGRLVYL